MKDPVVKTGDDVVTDDVINEVIGNGEIDDDVINEVIGNGEIDDDVINEVIGDGTKDNIDEYDVDTNDHVETVEIEDLANLTNDEGFDKGVDVDEDGYIDDNIDEGIDIDEVGYIDDEVDSDGDFEKDEEDKDEEDKDEEDDEDKDEENEDEEDKDEEDEDKEDEKDEDEEDDEDKDEEDDEDKDEEDEKDEDEEDDEDKDDEDEDKEDEKDEDEEDDEDKDEEDDEDKDEENEDEEDKDEEDEDKEDEKDEDEEDDEKGDKNDVKKSKPTDKKSSGADSSSRKTSTQPNFKKRTLGDGSVVLGNGKILNPEDYVLYLSQMMINTKSSDIYFTYGEEPALRIYGEVRRILAAPKLEDSTLEAIAKVLMTEEDEKLYNKNLSCDIGYSVHGRRYRINISRQRGHKMIVARLLEEKIPTIQELGLPGILVTLTKKTSGIVFIAGPTGSGKSTTLAAMIEEINKTRACHVITIEDPIEYVFTPKKAIFDQKQLGRDVVSFASAMKYAMRQRPDVILFGETRDVESLKNALALAETGHLVLTTIHSRSAEQTINKIIAMVPEAEQTTIKNQISENMTAIVIQKLLKTIDGKGMVPAHEILLNNTAVENTIRENKMNQLKNVMYTYRSSGMQLLEDDLVRLAKEGKISVEMAILNSNDRVSLKRGLTENRLV